MRYPTAGNAYSEEEAQPFYVNAPFGIVLVHNGNLTNAHALKQELFDIDRRHINTEQRHRGADQRARARARARGARPAADARRDLRRRCARCTGACKGSYAVVALIAGHGLLAFRDPFGIRPLCFGDGDGRRAAR